MTTAAPVPRIGIVGTFDVANFGDLLFPIIAERELTQRLGAIELIRFSYTTQHADSWSYDTVAVSELPRMIAGLDALLIGGGHVIRFDKAVAPGYSPPAGIHHPTGYWLTPALIALQHDVPVAWNAPGMHDDTVAQWATPALRLALENSSYVAVRDALTRDGLLRYADCDITVVPDTAFGLANLLSAPPSVTFQQLSDQLGLDAPYVVVQAAPGTQRCAEFIGRHADAFSGHRFVSMPIGPVLGDDDRWVAQLPHPLHLPTWPSPLLMAELIAHSQGVVGNSFHLAVTALASGVPVIRSDSVDIGKFTGLRGFEPITVTSLDGPAEADRLASRLGRTPVTDELTGVLQRLDTHWDRIAALARAGRTQTSVQVNRYWQHLPTVLEDAELTAFAERTAAQQRADEAHQALAATTTALQQQADALRAEMARRIEALETEAQRRAEAGRAVELAQEHELRAAEEAQRALRADLATRDALVLQARRGWASAVDVGEALLASRSWRCTAPLRWVSGRLGRAAAPSPIIRMASILQSTMHATPYEWALVDGLFAFSDAADLASPGYRRAMSLLTGRDLSECPIEANIFHYGPGASLGVHQDLADKVVTHVLYFNTTWDPARGGCLTIHTTKDGTEVAATISPIVGTSAVLVRSDHSWHAVAKVRGDSPTSRRSVTVTFYRPGSISTMWPPEASPTPPRG